MSRLDSRISRLEKHGARNTAQLAGLGLPDDPIAFARVLGVDPDRWQRDLLTSTADLVLLNCPRQSGKSTIVAILALYHALFNSRSLVLLLSASLRQSSELFKKIAGYYRGLGRPVSSEVETALTLELVNGSRLISLPDKPETLRGFSPSLVLIDEAAQVSDTLYYEVVRPMLAVSRGRLILLSTPFGKRGFFWREWSEGLAWQKITITAEQCPRISTDFLREVRVAIGDFLFRQEFLCEFSDNVDQYFSYEEIRNAFSDDDVKPLFGPDGRLNL